MGSWEYNITRLPISRYHNSIKTREACSKERIVAELNRLGGFPPDLGPAEVRPFLH